MSEPISRPGYTYSPLIDENFRVIELTSLEPIISVKLVEYPDDSPLEYFALSYAWGSETNTETILCDGKAFKITPHLETGLRHICTTSGCARLWVDAICIDQASDAEKATQVKKMHHIYRKAISVYVWLGEAENGSDEAIAAINGVEIPPNPEKALMERILKLKSEAPKLFDASLFKPLAALSRRSWFRRLWIAQEYFYAQSVQFFCGKGVIDGTKLLQILRKFSINSFGGSEPPGFLEEEQLFVGYQALIELEKVKEARGKGNSLSFFDFVMLGRQRFAKEPVDRIYAVFGMAEGTDDIYRNEIPVDYSEDARANYWKVYTIFGKIALQHEPHLRLLSVVSSEERPEPLPSWCPNLNSTTATAELDSVKVYAAGWPWKEHGEPQDNSDSSFTRCVGHPNFKGKEENHVSISPTSNTVSIWGASLGRIVAIGPPRNWDCNVDTEDVSSVQPLAQALLDWLQSSLRFCAEHWKDEKTARDVWGEVLVGANSNTRRNKKQGLEEEDNSRDTKTSEPVENSETLGESEMVGRSERSDHPASADDAESSNDHETREKTEETEDSAYLFLTSVLTQILDLKPDVDWREQDPELLQLFEVAYSWIIFIEADWCNRILFATENGYLGYASEDAVIGDNVSVLYGGRSLYIFRRRGSEYVFISDAYVFDCMDGQIFEMLDEGLVKEELFAIS